MTFPELQKTDFDQKVGGQGGKLARLQDVFFLQRIRFTLKSSTDSKKSQCFWFCCFYDAEFPILRRRICDFATHNFLFYDEKSTNFKFLRYQIIDFVTKISRVHQRYLHYASK